jgi:hypothetical protein
LYDYGNAATDKPLIPGTTTAIPYDGAALGTGKKWVVATGLNIDLSAHAGKEVCMGLAGPSQASNSGFSILYDTVTGATRANHSTAQTSVPDPFVTASTNPDQAWTVYFIIEPINPPGGSIDSLGTSGTVHVGKSESITTTGLGTLTSVSVGGKAAASIAAPGGDGSVTIVGFIDGETYPPMGTVSVVVGDGTTTATKSDALLTTMEGWQYVDVSGLDTTEEFSLAKAFGGGDVPTQLHVINDGTGVLNANGTLTNWAVGTYTCWARMAAGTWAAGTMKSFTFTVHEPIDLTTEGISLGFEFSSPTLFQDTVITPDDWVIPMQLSSPGLALPGEIVPDDLSLSFSLTSPQVTEPPSGLIYADRIVLILK